MESAPKIDPRSAGDVTIQVNDLMTANTKNWQGFDPSLGVSSALTGIFARYSELIIERLNETPRKNFLAFLDMIGAAPLSPQPAHVPLTFSLAAGSAVDGVVLAGTQVAAIPGDGEKNPVIFETVREMIVTAAQLVSVYARNPNQDKYADLSVTINSSLANGLPVFAGNQPIEHIVYLGHAKLLRHPGLRTLQLNLTLVQAIANPDPRALQWEISDGVNWIPKQFDSDSTANQTQTGQIVFSGLSAFPDKTIMNVTSKWLRCRLLTPITPASSAEKGMVRVAQLPSISQVTMTATMGRENILVDHAYTNGVPIDISKDFFPFGATPKFGDIFYFSAAESLSEIGTTVTIRIKLTNPVGSKASPIPNVGASADLTLKCEFWNGIAWVSLGVAAANAVTNTLTFSDTTKALTIDGAISFTLPASSQPLAISGVTAYWARLRILTGDYGKPATYTLKAPPDASAGYILTPATYAPPSISLAQVDYNLARTDKPEAIVTYNDFSYDLFSGRPFNPFRPTKDTQPTLYLGFDLPVTRNSFPNRKLSFYNGLDETQFGGKSVPFSPGSSSIAGTAGSTVVHQLKIVNPLLQNVTFKLVVTGTSWDTTLSRNSFILGIGEETDLRIQIAVPADAVVGSSDTGFLSMILANNSTIEYELRFATFVGDVVPDVGHPKLDWEYANPAGWFNLVVVDDSESFTRPGLVEFLAPDDFSPREEFGLSRYWLRIGWENGGYSFDPRLHRLLLNTMMASQGVTVKNEILGSSNGTKDQIFQTTRAPILDGQILEVREGALPSADEQSKLKNDLGYTAITPIYDATGRAVEAWVQWMQVADFYGSTARDRHYVLDHVKGEITFGDGINGLIPPTGQGNVRMTSYRTGGGASGNRPAGTINQLKTTVPYVEKVTNYEASGGGAEAEDVNSLLDRAPRSIRHRDRAVTIEDFEDLAKLATPEVARAKCVPLRNLIVDPDANVVVPGTVSLIIVPKSDGPKPTPSLGLMSLVEDFIEQRQSPVAQLVVVGPDYIRVNVETEVALVSMDGAGQVEMAINDALDRFLHPLTGGLDGAGWDFGRRPHRSDLLSLIEGVIGVDHVRYLNVTRTSDRTGQILASEEYSEIGQSSCTLVYSGTHKIGLTMDAE